MLHGSVAVPSSVQGGGINEQTRDRRARNPNHAHPFLGICCGKGHAYLRHTPCSSLSEGSVTAGTSCVPGHFIGVPLPYVHGTIRTGRTVKMMMS